MTQEEIERASLLLTWLERPYYQNTNPIYKATVSFFMGVVVYGFLVIIRPLPIQKITTNIDLFALNTAILIITVFLVFHFIVKKIFAKFFDSNHWTISKHLITFFGIIIIASLINWNTNQYLVKEITIQIDNYFQFFAIAVGLGMFPMSFYLIIDERYARYEKKSNASVSENRKLPEKVLKEIKTNITIYSYNKKDFINLDVNQLAYITSDSNYASFFILEDGCLKESILRNTLKKIEESLAEYDTIIRCHKSYIINKSFVTNVQGNAHGFRVYLKYSDKEIPLSRKFTREDMETL